MRLRDELDSHVLAASLLEEAGGSNARHLLRRGVDFVAAQLSDMGLGGGPFAPEPAAIT
jgi:hypothetical protein